MTATILRSLAIGTVAALLLLAASASMVSRAAPPPTTGTVTITLDLQPDVSNEVCFLATLPSPSVFCLGDDDSETIEGVLGQLDVSIVNTAGIWQVKGVDCEPDLPPAVSSNGNLRTIIGAGDVIECTYSMRFSDVEPTSTPVATASPTATATATSTPVPATATPVVATATATPTQVPPVQPAPVIVQCANGQIVLLGQTCPTVASLIAPTLPPTVVGRITAPNTGDAGLVQE